MALINCSRDRRHQFPDHLAECPYCLQKGLRSAPARTVPSTLSVPVGQQPTSSVARGTTTAQSPVRRSHPVATTLGWVAALAVLAVVIAVVHGFLPRPQPAGPSATHQSTAAVGPGICLTETPADLLYALPPDWASHTTPCDQPDALVRIIAVQADGEATDGCQGTDGCMRFRDSDTVFQFNAIPRVGQCFYGYHNTGWPDKGKYSGSGWPRALAQCGLPSPEWIDKGDAATVTGVDESFLEPAHYKVESIGAADNSCTQGQGYWQVTYSKDTVTGLCTLDE